MSEIRVDSIGNESNTGGPVLSGITEFSGQQYFIPPKGTTAERPSDCPPGSIRFNTDSAHLEYWNGLVWLEFEASSVELGNQLVSNSAGGTGHRGVLGGMQAPGYVVNIEYLTFSTLGNTQDFGDLTEPRGNGVGSCSSRTRGIFINGYQTPANTSGNTIDYITISSTGDAIDFDDSQNKTEGRRAGGNQTRGISHGGPDRSNSFTTYNVIDYFTIATTGSVQDFGDISVGGGHDYCGACSSPTRVLFGGGSQDGGPNARINFVTTSTTGNSSEFGDLTSARLGNAALSNSTRGIWAAGSPSAPTNSTIDFITLATLGNAQDFGDTTFTATYATANASPTRGIIMGSQTSMDFITIATTGNGSDFGDNGFVGTNADGGFISNGHGGL